ncbi:MAG: prepilin-type N-terminal cleavage/methylation domain-containing protein [Kiritimatiellae bacterium]|nr:prepilin-type N-terminal cleavage/methylation domain-containing protein [Kiritimatiellia bacterium]
MKRRIDRRERAGFTLMEMMLVVVVIGIAAGIVIPRFVGTSRRLKLRAAARTVVMAGKYARGAAVLRQHPMAVIFDLDRQTVELVNINRTTGTRERESFFNRREEAGAARVPAGEPDEDAASKAASDVTSQMTRDLPDNVSFESVDSGREGMAHGAARWVYYYPNGTCDGYVVRIKDDQDARVTVSVSSVSGRARVEE